MTTDLAAWLSTCYDEAEAAARLATEGPWSWEATGDMDSSWAVGQVQAEDGTPLTGQLEHGQGVVIDGVCESINGNLADAVHIAATDPGHRLRDIALKRAILAEHAHEQGWGDGTGCNVCHRFEGGTWAGGWCATVRQLATEFSDKPGYLPGWKPSEAT